MQLRSKLLLAFLALSLLPLTLLGVLVYRSTVRHTERLVGHRLQANVVQVADAIDELMRDCVEDMRHFGRTRLFAQARPADISAELRLEIGAHPSYTQLLYVDGGGRVLAASDSASVGRLLLDLHSDLAEEFRGALGGAPGDAYISDWADTTGLALGSPLRFGWMLTPELELVTRVSSPSGAGAERVLVAVVNLQRIRTVLQDLDRRTPGDENAFLLDSAGRILMSSTREIVPLSLHPGVASGLLASSLKGRDSDYHLYQQRGRGRVVSGRATIGRYGVTRVGNWRLISTAPYDDLVEPAQETLHDLLLVGLVMLLTAALLASYLPRTVCRPVHLLANAAGELERGNLAARVTPGSRDEVGLLARRFNRMADALVEQRELVRAKAAAAGEVVVDASLESREADAIRVHVAVSDTGPGIPREQQGRIFEAFQQADSSMTRRFGGTGLGLSICSQLVELMGGRIWLESEVGRGSTFHFTVRIGLPQEAPHLTRAKHGDLTGVRVLVVDDNATARNILLEMLQSWRMLPVAVDGGRSALETLERARNAGSPFRLVLTDGQMPEMDGFGLAERIAQDRGSSDVSVIMLTSAGERGDGARCRELGIAGYLTKPVSQSDLWDGIVSVLYSGDAEPALVTVHSIREGRPRLKILLAEDNPVNQQLAARILEKRGHSVLVVPDGRQALEAVSRERYDLVLMDIQMPEMDGFETTAAIRARENSSGVHLPIIALTAHAMTGDRERCLATGMDGYLSKPLRAHELIDAIEHLIPDQPPSPPARDVPSASPTNAGAFEHAALLAVVEGDLTLLHELAEVFLADTPALVTELRDAVTRRDLPRILALSHRLRGSVANFQAHSATAAAQRLEEMANRGESEGLDAALADFNRALAELTEDLRAL